MAIAIRERAPDKIYVDGAWIDATGGKTFEVRNPATGDVVGNAADATIEQLSLIHISEPTRPY